MVQSLGAGLEGERDEQTDGDGEEVQDEVADSVNSVFEDERPACITSWGLPLA